MSRATADRFLWADRFLYPVARVNPRRRGVVRNRDRHDTSSSVWSKSGLEARRYGEQTMNCIHE